MLTPAAYDCRPKLPSMPFKDICKSALKLRSHREKNDLILIAQYPSEQTAILSFNP